MSDIKILDKNYFHLESLVLRIAEMKIDAPNAVYVHRRG